MKSEPAVPMPRKTSTRPPMWSMPLVVVCFAISVILSGCGDSMPLAPAPQAEPATSGFPATGTTTEPAPSANDLAVSLHQRVMAEQAVRSVAPGTDLRQPDGSDAAALPATTTPPVQPLQPTGKTAIVLTGGQTPLKGIWGGTPEQLATYLVTASPSPRFTVPTQLLAEYYVGYCAETGLRADVLWAQMIHETGYGMYGGAVRPEQNNYAGIGATGGGQPGATFVSAEAGVMAQVAHMVAYVYSSSPVPWASAVTDPRYDAVNPRGVASVLADLNGRWAVPGTTYGQAIETIVQAINSH